MTMLCAFFLLQFLEIKIDLDSDLITEITEGIEYVPIFSGFVLIWKFTIHILIWYRSGTVNSTTVNSKFHLILSFFEIFARFLSFYHFMFKMPS